MIYTMEKRDEEKLRKKEGSKNKGDGRQPQNLNVIEFKSQLATNGN